MTIYDAMRVQGVLQDIVAGSEFLIKKDNEGNPIKREDGNFETIPPKYELGFKAKYSIAKLDKCLSEEVSIYRETKKKEYTEKYTEGYDQADEDTKAEMDADFVETASSLNIEKEIPKIKEDVFTTARLPYEYVRILLPVLE